MEVISLSDTQNWLNNHPFLKHNLHVRELATKTSISELTLRNWMVGVGKPDDAEINRIIAATGVATLKEEYRAWVRSQPRGKMIPLQ